MEYPYKDLPNPSILSTEDRGFIQLLGQQAKPHIEQFVEDLYVWLPKNVSGFHLIFNTPEMIKRVKKAQIIYWHAFFDGIIDDTYIESRCRIGKIHAMADRPIDKYIESMSFAADWWQQKMTAFNLPQDKMLAITHALNKLIFFDTAIIYTTYHQQQKQEMNVAIERGELAERTVISLSKELHAILNAAGDGIIGLNAEGKITLLNPTAARTLGHSEDQLSKLDFKILFSTEEPYQENSQKNIAAIEKTLTQGTKETHLDAFFKSATNKLLPISYVCTPLYKGDALNGAVIVFRDMGDVSNALRRYAEELKMRNEELKRFTYAASHDLQEPLRAINGYTQLLQAQFGETLADPEAEEFFEFIITATDRMKKMIMALLDYSHISTIEKDITDVNLEKALAVCLQNLTVIIGETEAIIHHKTLPTVQGDTTLLTQLLQNLIGNALKYRKKDTVPKIQINCTEQGDAWLLSIQDNGIGIDPKHYQRIFDIFQRLHSRKEYEGTGVGLSICKKIVERHHGRIWVESKEMEGATFYFLLPKIYERGIYDNSLS